jgi:hypothetical protein
MKKGVYNMNSKTIKFFLLLLLGTLFTLSNIFAEGGDKGKNSNTLEKPGSPIRAYMNINFISTIIKNTGITDINAGQDASGLIYPKGSGKTAVYQSGFLWGATIDTVSDNIHIGGTVYREGTQSGWINANGTVEAEDDPDVRIWRVRPDVYPGGPNVDLSPEAADEFRDEADVRSQYELDWTQWPASIGAPYDDKDTSGTYDPSIDVPGFPGANQTIWFVANDQAQSRTSFMYGTDPMGMEMQVTLWAYAQTGALGNMFFRRYLLINKTDILPGGPKTFDSMYVSMWSDPDVGDSGDDYAGSDTVLSVSYCYNGKGQDAVYGGTTPALGFDFFQGPLVPGVAGEDRNKNGIDDASDYAIFKNKTVGPGLINLPMTAAFYYINSDPTLTDPVQGSYPQGAVRWYRFMKGRIGLTNEPFVDPNTGQQTTFTLTGDPVTGTGWIDGQQFAYADRRIGMASGPFTMAPGDTQEVVVAQILAGAVTGVDRLSAISLMKFYDQIAQVAYDNFFDLPVPPPPPDVSVSALDQQIVLDWSKDPARVQLTESSDSKGYKFQGYNVYQLPTASSSPSEGVRVATYDIIDGVGKIYDLVFDPTTGSVVELPVQFGNDVGIKRFISITQDAINQVPLVNGIRYYFAVTAYNYNGEFGVVPNNLENPLRIFTIIPHSADPGVTYGDGTGGEIEVTHSGTADGGPTVTIVDPTATTGNDYEAFFTERPEIRDPDGFWVPASIVIRKGGPNGPDTLTGSSIQASGVYGPQTGIVQLNFLLDLVSVDFDWADGITLKFYSGITILDAPSFEAGGGTVTPEVISYAPDSIIVNMGLIDHSYTADGIFHGGEEWSFNVQAELPITFDWQIYDDGYGGGPVDAFGVTTVTALGNVTRLAKYWNVRDIETDQVVLVNQSVIDGIDLYPDRDDQLTDYGLDASPIVDGVQINMSVGYAAPVTISQNNEPTVNGEEVFSFSGSNVWWISDFYTVCDFQRFGYSPATVLGTLGPSGGGYTSEDVGTTDVNLLQQDLEFRFTGILADTVLSNGDTLTITASGGSLITLFGASGYSIADHPLNPNPGSEDPFTIRVPFEIWNVDSDEQINAIMWDRSGNPTVNGGAVWVLNNREYLWLVNTPYAAVAIDPTGSEIDEFGTWNVVFYLTDFTIGDVVKLYYDNPIQIGTDTYAFTTTGSTFDNSLAQSQVGDINVFPNPYYGFSSEELNKYNRFVTFNHLPTQATVRIFNLAGVLVRSLEKQDAGQFMYWDLNNDYGLPVASGLYIVYIDLPELGSTKVLKVAIIQEDQVLDRF